VRRGELYYIDLGPAFGRELGGTRSVAIVSSDVFNLVPFVVLVVVGEEAAMAPPGAGLLVPASDSGAPADVVLYANQLRAVDPTRFPQQPSGSIPTVLMDKLSASLRTYLSLT
jgi:mRNA-degrading endonuclease toxin of MazEF toxin-antitoxin module